MHAHAESPRGEPVRRFDAERDRLPDHYAADTIVPYDLLVERGTPLPAHIETALHTRAVQQGYAPLALNHAHARRAHMDALATPGIAPGSPLPRRRRINWWSLLAGIAAATFILLSIVGTFAILQQIAER